MGLMDIDIIADRHLADRRF